METLALLGLAWLIFGSGKDKSAGKDAGPSYEPGSVATKGSQPYVYVGQAPTRTGPPGAGWLRTKDRGAWQAGTAYKQGDVVQFEGSYLVWTSTRSAAGTAPDQNHTDWYQLDRWENRND